MPRYDITCAHRNTGVEEHIVVDAPDAAAARAWAIHEGHLVGNVAEVTLTPAPVALQPASLQAYSPGSGQSNGTAAGRYSANGSAPLRGAAAAPQEAILHNLAAEMSDISAALRELAGSPLVAKPRRTILYAVVMGIAIGASINAAFNLVVGLMTGSSLNGIGNLSSVMSGASGAAGDGGASTKALEAQLNEFSGGRSTAPRVPAPVSEPPGKSAPNAGAPAPSAAAPAAPKMVDIPGVGQVAVPEGSTPSQIEDLVKKIKALQGIYDEAGKPIGRP
ncbi:hypothetical protein BH11PLA1_BH11PLA1_05520 [soil metagenome]